VMMMVVFLGMLFYLSWHGALFLIAAMPVVAYVSRVFGKRIEKVTEHEREDEGAVLSVLNRCLAAFKAARIGAMRAKALDTCGRGVEKFLGTVLLQLQACRRVRNGDEPGHGRSRLPRGSGGRGDGDPRGLSFGGYIAFLNVFLRAVSTVMGFFRPLADLYRLGETADPIQTFLATAAPEYFTPGDRVALRDVSFAYSGEPVLDRASLEVRPGEKVMIVGRNGTGKTTLANILAGYLAPNGGKVMLPGRRSCVTIPIEFSP